MDLSHIKKWLLVNIDSGNGMVPEDREPFYLIEFCLISFLS